MKSRSSGAILSPIRASRPTKRMSARCSASSCPSTTLPPDHLREVLNQAVGPEGEEEIERQVRWQGLSERVAPERMAAALKDEKPVTIAVALSRFPARYSGEVLAHFPEQKRLESVEQLSRGVRVA